MTAATWLLPPESQKVDTATFGAMLHCHDGQAGTFAYLLFILLYFPGVAATSAIRREAGGYWTLFAVGWTTGLAFFNSTLFYQLASYSQHPQQSLLWVGIAMGFFLGIYRAAGQYWAPLRTTPS